MANQLDFFEGEESTGKVPSPRPDRFGKAEIEYKETAAILTRASGFVGEYDFTLNPYSGCAFGCSYCYAAFFSRDRELQDSWGHWVTVKENALDRLRRMRPDTIKGKRIYMSSVTDPYQPIEKELILSRSLLQELVQHQPRLVIQTRSPLATRDIDVFRAFETLQLNMTVTTDDESVRKAFEPRCPSNEKRLTAVREISEAGIRTCITMTPLLPVRDPAAFADQLLETGVDRFVVQPFHATKQSRFVAGTGNTALAIVEKMKWTEVQYREVVELLRQRLPRLTEGREGFAPV